MYHDPWGVSHPLGGNTVYFQALNPGGSCEPGTNISTTNSLATDGSGYVLNVPAATYPAAVIASRNGKVIGAPEGLGTGAGTTTDRNGNEITVSNSGVFTDTLGTTVMTVSGSGTASSPTKLTYTAPSGASAYYQINYTNYTVATNFGITGINETKSSAAVPLVSSIVLPDGSQYSFTYEATPGSCTPWSGTTCVTARIASVTLPTGGTISYLYYNSNNNFPACTTGNNGIFPDGSASCLQRTLYDGTNSNTWTYIRTLGSGAASATLVTAPKLPYDSAANQAIIQFQGIYETQRDIYQGLAPTFTLPIAESTLQTANLMEETQTCYTTTSPCTGTAVTPPIAYRSVISALPAPGSITLEAEQVAIYNSVGMPTETDAYAFGSGAVGGLINKTSITYASLPPNITAFRQTVTSQNGAGTTLAKTNYNYDETTPTPAPTGTPQLTSISGSRGNLTSVQNCTVLYLCSSYLKSTMTYDTAGQLLTVKDPLNNQTSFDYTDNYFTDNGSNPPQAYAPANPTDAFPKTVTPPLNGAITFGYYFYSGQMASSKDQNLNSSYTHFDSIGRLLSTYGPSLPIAGSPSPGNANPWTLINYTSSTQIDAYTDINDTSTTAVSTCTVCRHDQAVVDGLGRGIHGYLVSDPEGQTKVDTAYDPLGRVLTSSHPYRSTNDTTYGIETPTYDALGRTIKVTHPDNTYSQAAFGASVSGTGVNTAQLCSATTYGLGFPSLFTDESGRRREIWTDALGRTIEADEPDSSGNLTSNTCYSYDPLGNLLQIVHGSQTRTYAYDALSRVTSVSIPELANCAVTYGYDNNSNLQTRTAPAPNQTSCSTTVTTTYYHDALNRLTKISYGTTSPVATPTVQYGYDANSLSGCTTTPPTLTDSNPKGRMTSMCDGSGATSWAHDAAGRIITEKRIILGTSPITLSYTYNLDSSIATVTYPSGKTVTYTVSNAQRLTAANDTANSVQFATAASYSAPGGLSGVITGQISGFGGITESHNYNSSLEYTSTKATSTAGTAMDLTVNYASSGDNGSITSVTNNADNGRNQTLTYDPLNRILSAQSSAISGADCWGQVFGPNGTVADDALGNFTNINSGTQTQPTCQFGMLTVSVDGNNHITTSGFGYDAAGNMTSDGSTFYTFDAENRLTLAPGVSGYNCYIYDGLGLRVAKKSGTNNNCSGGTYAKLYWRSLFGDALTETDGTGSVTVNYTEYVFFAGRRVASRVTGSNSANTAIFYYFADQLGSVRTITTGSGSGQTPGQLCFDQDYTPYGQEVFTTSQMTRLQTTACPPSYKFTGYERDSETGLDYAFARYYSSRLGRFLSTDPLGGSVGDLQSHNAYAYTGNNPLNRIDPSGMTDCIDGHYGCNCDPLADDGCTNDLRGARWADFWGGDAQAESGMLMGALGLIDEFDILEVAFTPTDITLNPEFWGKTGCDFWDCPDIPPFLLVYGNWDLLDLLTQKQGGKGKPLFGIKETDKPGPQVTCDNKTKYTTGGTITMANGDPVPQNVLDNIEGFASKLSAIGPIKGISTITVVPVPSFQTTFTVGGASIYTWIVAFNYTPPDGKMKPYTFLTDPVALTCRVPSPKA